MNADFPLFDGHLHFSQAYLDQGLRSLDLCGVKSGISLWSAAPGFFYSSDYSEFLRLLKNRTGDRLVSFFWPDWTHFGWDSDRFVETLCRDMKRYDAAGCRGLKVWKDLGMTIIHPDGTPARMDDPRLEPIWQTAMRLKWTIAVHQGDPAARFQDRCRTGLSREELWVIRDRVIAAHPDLNFILCHNGNDVGSIAAWCEQMDRFPNVLGELTRDPLEHGTVDDVRAFLVRYRDRVHFGTDMIFPVERPPDHEWNVEHCYDPWRRKLLSLELDEETFHKITLENGVQRFCNLRLR